MKNLHKYILLIFLLVFLSSCFVENNDEVNKAKQELLSGTTNEDSSSQDNSNDNLESQGESMSGSFLDNEEKYNEAENTEVKKEKYLVEYLTDKRFISLDSLEGENFNDLKVEFTGNTLIDDVEKIIVKFTNEGSDFPDDNYTLQTFNPGDNSFTYRAFDSFETLDYGVNEYIIEAHSGNDISKLKVVLNVFENEEDYLVSKQKKVENNSYTFDMDSLPENSDFGSPTEIKNGIYTYTDIKGLELKDIGDRGPELESDSITAFLSENSGSWFYWNTLRPISGDNGVSFYVIRLDGDEYFYEKHYYIDNGLYGTILLDTGYGVDLDSLSDKNKELGEKNKDFVITNITDKLFINILNQ